MAPPWEAPAPAGRQPRWRAVPLRAQLVGVLVIALLAALTATGFGVQAVLRGFLVSQVDKQLATYYRLAQTDQRFLRGALTRGVGIPTTFAFYVHVDGHPELSGASTPRPDVSAPAFSPISKQEADARGGRPFTVPAGGGGPPWRAVVVPATFGDDELGQLPASVTLALPLEGAEQAVRQLRLLTLVIGGVAILGCAGLGWLAIRRAFRPLREVEGTAAAIAAGDLSRRMPPRPESTEVGRLTASLNGMLSQIESAFRAREASQARTRRFAADASHELRTPLAAIRGYAELYRQGAVPAPEVPRAMQRIEDEATRMGGLVEDLLLLARLDERRGGQRQTVDLAVLAGDAVHDARGLDPDRPVTLAGLSGAAGPAPAVVTGEENRLRQVVANLVANAIRHTPPGTPVEVAVGVLPGTAVLEVRDHGPGLTPEQAERVFERFYRVDSSRWRGRGGGSGLGLSIVDAVVSAHGGSVTVRQTPGGGATFAVQLPATPVEETSSGSS